MSTESQMQLDSGRLTSYFATETMRTGEHRVSTWLAVRDDMLDGGGRLRIGPVAYTVDMATGMAMGLAVLGGDRWVVTTDIDVRVISPLSAGSLRVDADVVRAGATTVVSAFTLHDDASGAAVGGGTCTGRPFPITFDRSALEVPLGDRFQHIPGEPAGTEMLAEQLGFAPVRDSGVRGAVELGIEDWLRNPWGILHGGVTACLIDVAAETAAVAALGGLPRVSAATIRFLAPGRVGPVRAMPRLMCAAGDEALVEVRVTDQGAAGRLIALASLTVG